MFGLPIEEIGRIIDEANAGHIGSQEALADIECPGWDMESSR